ncbi:MAG: NUDIX hydrolase [Chromatiales bacterium]|jgi:ADP-ribose pyrophosphatase|nr:NUDIX hydrolase [Chromatiales bacterium]
MKIYRGRIITVDVEEVTLPNGSQMRAEIVRHPGGAAIIALDAQRHVCLLRHYRPVANSWLWELPAGKIDHNEAALRTAQRELREEAGLTAARWESLGAVLSSPGVFSEIIHLYLARGLMQGTQRPDEDEVFELHWLPFEDAVECAASGEFNDAKTIIGLMRAAAWLRKHG